MLALLGPAGNRLAQAVGALRRHGPPAAPAPGAVPLARPHLAQLAQPSATLPAFVRACPVAGRYLELLGPLDWEHFPERPTQYPWPGPSPAPRAPYVAAYLVKLDEGLRSMGHLRRYLCEHPALVWILGFPLTPDPTAPHGFAVAPSLPSRRQFGRVLRELDNAAAQFLLDGTVHLLRQALPADGNFGDVVALDTKHILAWVTENNPKAYVRTRYDKTKQPKGDPDCKLGCKKRHNQGAVTATTDTGAPRPIPYEPRPSTPTTTARYRPARPRSVSITGATPPASSPPKCRTGVNSCWPS